MIYQGALSQKRFARVVRTAVPPGWRVYDLDGLIARKAWESDSLEFVIQNARLYFVVKIGINALTGWTDEWGRRHPPLTDGALREVLRQEFHAGVARGLDEVR